MSKESKDEKIEIINEEEIEQKKTYINFGCFQILLGNIY